MGASSKATITTPPSRLSCVAPSPPAPWSSSSPVTSRESVLFSSSSLSLVSCSSLAHTRSMVCHSVVCPSRTSLRPRPRLRVQGEDPRHRERRPLQEAQVRQEEGRRAFLREGEGTSLDESRKALQQQVDSGLMGV